MGLPSHLLQVKEMLGPSDMFKQTALPNLTYNKVRGLVAAHSVCSLLGTHWVVGSVLDTGDSMSKKDTVLARILSHI